MTMRTSLSVCLSAIGLLSGCGGAADDGMRATLTDDACTYEGTTTPHAGRFTIAVSNDTRFFSVFLLAAVKEDGDADDAASLANELLRRFRKPGEGVGRAPWRSVVGSAVAPGDTSVIPADVRAGSYVVLCVIQPTNDARRSSQDVVPPKAVYVGARLAATGAPTFS